VRADDEKQKSFVRRARSALEILRDAANDASRTSREGGSAVVSLMRTRSNSERVERAREAMVTLRDLALKTGGATTSTEEEILQMEDASNLLSQTAEMSLDLALARSKRCPKDCSG
jgi:hypothetical protein